MVKHIKTLENVGDAPHTHAELAKQLAEKINATAAGIEAATRTKLRDLLNAGTHEAHADAAKLVKDTDSASAKPSLKKLRDIVIAPHADLTEPMRKDIHRKIFTELETHHKILKPDPAGDEYEFTDEYKAIKEKLVPPAAPHPPTAPHGADHAADAEHGGHGTETKEPAKVDPGLAKVTGAATGTVAAAAVTSTVAPSFFSSIPVINKIPYLAQAAAYVNTQATAAMSYLGLTTGATQTTYPLLASLPASVAPVVAVPGALWLGGHGIRAIRKYIFGAEISPIRNKEKSWYNWRNLGRYAFKPMWETLRAPIDLVVDSFNVVTGRNKKGLLGRLRGAIAKPIAGTYNFVKNNVVKPAWDFTKPWIAPKGMGIAAAIAAGILTGGSAATIVAAYLVANKLKAKGYDLKWLFGGGSGGTGHEAAHTGGHA